MRLIVKFFEWLKKLPVPVVYLLFLFLNLTWACIICTVLDHFDLDYSQRVAGKIQAVEDFIDTIYFGFTLLPFTEETLFRWIPLLLLFMVLNPLCRNPKISKKQYLNIERYLLLSVVILISLQFGFVHGNVYNILIQGVLGLNLMIIYLRALFVRRDKGLRTRFQFVPYVEAGLYHCLYNLMLIPLDRIYEALQ